LADQNITNDEADNLKLFLGALPADLARAVFREASEGNITTSNTRKMVARDMFKEYLQKITRVKKPNANQTP